MDLGKVKVPVNINNYKITFEVDTISKDNDATGPLLETTQRAA